MLIVFFKILCFVLIVALFLEHMAWERAGGWEYEEELENERCKRCKRYAKCKRCRSDLNIVEE